MGKSRAIIAKQSGMTAENARVVELADSLDSGSSVRKDVRVQVPPRAPKRVPETAMVSGIFLCVARV